MGALCLLESSCHLPTGILLALGGHWTPEGIVSGFLGTEHMSLSFVTWEPSLKAAFRHDVMLVGLLNFLGVRRPSLPVG